MLCVVLLILSGSLLAQEPSVLNFIDSLTNIISQQKPQSDVEQNLRFTVVDYIDTGDFEEDDTRTVMIAIFNEYLVKPEINWMVFPFILKYLKTAGYSEIGLIRELYGYGNKLHQDSWYLLKFMQANASSPAIKEIIKGELRVVKKP